MDDGTPTTSGGGAPVAVFGPKLFLRTTGQPNVFQETFTATEGTGRLELFNGGPDSGGQVTSAWVLLNGKEVLGPDDFKKGDWLLRAPLVLEAQNTLQITLASAPKASVTVRIIQEFPFEEDTSGIIKADLAVTDLALTPDRCDPGTAVTAQATVANRGPQASGPATLTFTLDNNEIGRVAVEALRPGGSAPFSVSLPAQGPGRHQLWAHVEPEAGMIDTSPDNNSRLATLRVSGESPPVPELEFGPPQFDPGPPAHITLKVSNPGFVDLSNIGLSLFVTGPSFAPEGSQNPATTSSTSNDLIIDQPCVGCDVNPDVIIAALSAGESTEVQFPWPYGAAGQYVVQLNATNLPALFPAEEATETWDLILPNPATPTSNLPLWFSMGPYNITGEANYGPPNTGHITSLAVDPQHPNIIYAAGVNYGGLSGAGIWKTTDGGKSWMPLGDNLPQMNITAIALDPADPDIIYCAAGTWWSDPLKPVAQGLPQPITGLIFKSIDGGQHWSLFAHPADGYSKLVVIHLYGDVIIYAASNHGVMRYMSNDPWSTSSADSQWHLSLSGKIGDLVVHPTKPWVVFAVRYHETIDPTGKPTLTVDGLYRTFGGPTATPNDWDKVFVGDAYRSGRVDLFPANPAKVYFFTYDRDHNTDSLWTSEIRGDPGTWKLAFTAPATSLGAEPAFLRADPVIDDLVYVGFSGDFIAGKWYPGNFVRMQKLLTSYSDVFGYGATTLYQWKTWKITGLHPDQHAMAFLPVSAPAFERAYVLGNDGGVYRGGRTFLFDFFDSVAPINNGLISAEYYAAGFDVSPINPFVMIGGLQDNGVVIWLPFSGFPFSHTDWNSVGDFGDGYAAVIAPSDPQTMYAIDSNNNIQRSTNGGADWQGVQANWLIGTNDRNLIFTNPDSAKTLYLGGLKQVQETVDGGDDWFEIGPNPLDVEGTIVQVAAVHSALLGSVLYAGTDKYGQIWARTPDMFWWVVDKHPDPNATVTSIVVAPTDHDVLFVAYDNCTKDKRLRRFKRTGSVWTSEWITGNLPQIHATTKTKLQIFTLAVDPTNSDSVFVGTDKGVYWGHRVTDLFGSQYWFWQPFNHGLPLVEVTKLMSLPVTGEIRAATYGRGVWTVEPDKWITGGEIP